MTKPDPWADTLRSAGARLPLRLKKSSKNSSNGAPFGTLGSGAPSAPFRVWLVEMLTTASISFSAIGATLGGPRPDWARAGARSMARPPRPIAAARADRVGVSRDALRPPFVEGSAFAASDSTGPTTMPDLPVLLWTHASRAILTSYQPDDDYAGAHSGSTAQAQRLLRRLRRCREKPQAQLGRRS